jgi:hypothetical protein
MTTEKILAEIDSEIARLQKVRALLSSDGTVKTTAAPPVRRRRKMSAAARKKIADAQRKTLGKTEVHHRQIGERGQTIRSGYFPTTFIPSFSAATLCGMPFEIFV